MTPTHYPQYQGRIPSNRGPILLIIAIAVFALGLVYLLSTEERPARNILPQLSGSWAPLEHGSALVLTFLDETRYEVDFEGNGYWDIRGEYTLENGRIWMTDVAGHIADFCGSPGIYRLSQQDKSLIFERESDSCQERSSALSLPLRKKNGYAPRHRQEPASVPPPELPPVVLQPPQQQPAQTFFPEEQPETFSPPQDLPSDKYRLLYANDFEDHPVNAVHPARAYSAGVYGESASVEAAFPWQYKPRVIGYANGKKGIRFPTILEDKGGYDYSMMTPYVVFRGPFLSKDHLFLRWTVYLPRIYDNSKPAYYYDHRYLFRYYIEGANGRELMSMRFINDKEIGFYFQETLQGPTIRLPFRPEGGQPYEVTLDIELRPEGRIQANFAGIGHPPAYFSSRFEKGNVFYTVPPGNALLHNTDLNYFSSLDSVEVYEVLE